MKKRMLVARNVDEEAYVVFRRTAVERRLSIGKALTQAMKLWVKGTPENKKDFGKMMEVAGLIKTGKKVNWSEHVDDILYGSENDIPRH